ncbi:hypothetical protein K6119_07115 [Paracrocinitomix mangrovi]|uniref:hypothetical protein n=1 Tax=Paracrocinitomix mangrovi TaxID=2862509 RepID=UPI001C8E93F2|nr:hypothetical protein [Paracrocinitomix mangrovi]UKN03282.1 hypothetical protein K6119_07115 [Paracrocinitomix mangrovi]
MNDYIKSIKDSLLFSEIVDQLFFKPQELKSDTSDGSAYFINKINHMILSYDLTAAGQEINYYWDEEIIKTPYSLYYDKLCDCSLVVESVTRDSYTPVCFYSGKIYSIGGDGRTVGRRKWVPVPHSKEKKSDNKELADVMLLYPSP